MTKKGFSLIEVLVYLGILSIVSIAFFRVLEVSTRVQVSEVASNEVSNQVNFVMQTIQRLVRESSNIERAGVDDPATSETNEGDNLDTGATEYAYIKLRMKDPLKDPTCISLLETSDEQGKLIGAIFIEQGENGGAEGKCKDRTDENRITTDEVDVPLDLPGLAFTVFHNYPARDTTEISLTLNYNSENSQSKASRSAHSAVNRASAATFDSSLFPGPNGPYDIGLQSMPWKDIFFSGMLAIPDSSADPDPDPEFSVNSLGEIFQPNNFDNITSSNGRGMLVLYSRPNTNPNVCADMCSKHTGACFATFGFLPVGVPTPTSYILDAKACSASLTYGGLCFCQ